VRIRKPPAGAVKPLGRCVHITTARPPLSRARRFQHRLEVIQRQRKLLESSATLFLNILVDGSERNIGLARIAELIGVRGSENQCLHLFG